VFKHSSMFELADGAGVFHCFANELRSIGDALGAPNLFLRIESIRKC
jgi:hypothetical protein